MANLPFHLVVSGTYMQFENETQLLDLAEILLCHAVDRRRLYEHIVLDSASAAQGLMEEAGEDGKIRSASLVSGLKIIVDKYGMVYDPGFEIMKITTCDEGA